MTLLELLAVIATGGGSLGAGVAGVIAATRPKSQKSHSEPPQTSLAPPRVPRSEQMAEWAKESWTAERAAREIAEAQAQAADIEARRDHKERIAALERANSNHQVELRLIGQEMAALRKATESNASLLGTLRDHILRNCPQCEDTDPAPVIVRGGAAAR